MTKLEELEAAQAAAYAASAGAWEAYYDELMKIQKENSND
jgi:hypothetical protein